MGLLAVLLVGLVCTGHGRRVQTAPQREEKASHVLDANSVDGAPLLLALNPTVGVSHGVQNGLAVPHTNADLKPVPQAAHDIHSKFAHQDIHSKVAEKSQDDQQSSQDSQQSSQHVPSAPFLQPLARACLPLLVIFSVVWGTLPLTTKSNPAQIGRRTAAPAMLAENDSEGASVSSSIVGLFKNIVGSGVLALSFGVAAFTSTPAGILPALAILFALGGVSAYTFASIARVGDEVGADTYQNIWAKVFGNVSAILPALTVIFKTAVGALSYSIILGDSLASIASLGGLPAALCKPNTWILGLSGLVLLPLSLLRNLSALAVGSVIGTAGSLYTALFMTLRWQDQSYALGGKFYTAIPASSRPLFAAATSTSPLVNSSIFVLVSMIATTFLAHYNAPRFYQELAKPADGSSKQTAFNKVVAGAFGLAAILCGVYMASGFLTFGGASQGLILNSYATTDSLAFLARLGIVSSIIFSYPIIFVGLREGVLSLLKLDGSNNSVHVLSTVLLLSAVNGLSLVVKNLGLVVAVGGAALGSALVYIFPAMMFIQATRMKKKSLEAAGEKLPGGRLKEMYANYGLIGLGVTLGVIGVKMSLKSAGL